MADCENWRDKPALGFAGFLWRQYAATMGITDYDQSWLGYSDSSAIGPAYHRGNSARPLASQGGAAW